MEVWTLDLKRVSNHPKGTPVLGSISALLVEKLHAKATEEATRRGMGELALDTMDLEVRPDVSGAGILGITCLAKHKAAALYYNLDASQITEPPEVVAEIGTLLAAATDYTGPYSDVVTPDEL